MKKIEHLQDDYFHHQQGHAEAGELDKVQHADALDYYAQFTDRPFEERLKAAEKMSMPYLLYYLADNLTKIHYLEQAVRNYEFFETSKAEAAKMLLETREKINQLEQYIASKGYNLPDAYFDAMESATPTAVTP